MAEGIRLNKYLAQAGICSRRQADAYIEAGRVSVNGKPGGIGYLVFPGDEVALDGRDLTLPDAKTVLAWYKPVGVTCTEKDSHAEKMIRDVFSYPVRLTYAGRLDRDSEGLLLLTDDGDLIQRLMHGSSGHEKEYVVKVDREVTDDFLRAMSEGIYLKELSQTTRPCEVVREGKYTFHIILTQGLNRQIRRMCAALGFQVRSIKRVRVANIWLKDLKPGQYREITGEEREALYGMVKPQERPGP
ncbi:MAG: pseudouridine synthase [Lachnospiraceae bacterium]|nr:pseudouridine synthase [Lachnospiraceae bacterium]